MPALQLLRLLSWPELRHHPARHLSAVLAIVLGVALAFSVHLINASALAEFSAAVRGVNGEPDLVLRAQRDGFDDRLLDRAALSAQVDAASPVVEIDTYALRPQGGERVSLRLLGIDALRVGPLAPALLPRPEGEGDPRFSLFDPDRVFLNAAALQQLGVRPGEPLRLQHGLSLLVLRVGGRVMAGGGPLAVMDIAGAQAHFGRLGRLSRIDLRLAPGASRDTLLAGLALPPGVAATAPDDSTQRISNVSRAYRVNLTVLALVALFTGSFLVFSVLSLAVAKRTPQFALLGVLGLSAGERRRLVLAECALLGVVGSVIGLAAGTGLAQLALRWLVGDLGGGYFPGVTPSLRFSWPAAGAFAVLGIAAALAGGWLPARQAERLAPAQALKGLGLDAAPPLRAWWGPALLALGVALALLPPVGELPLAAYASVAALLLGGIACIPSGVASLLNRWPTGTRPLPLLAVARARQQRHTATVAVAGVVVSLSLAVALTVMVASFRDAVTRWLDSVLPADLYLRTAASGAAADTAWLPDTFVQRAAGVPGVARVSGLRLRLLQLDAQRPAVALIARPLLLEGNDSSRLGLPLVGDLGPAPQPGEVAVYVSEAVVDLYGARVGQALPLPLGESGSVVAARVRGVWRDYARQHGAIAIDSADYRRLTGDARINDLALWLRPGHDAAAVQTALRELAGEQAALLEFALPGEIRAASLRIFDRSFAVTYYLQAVAIAIGLFGIAASFSAQVLARRREFGLLTHLGLTRMQILGVVAGEALAWTAAGALLGIALGLAVSMVLVFVVNPQSFHWTMELLVPWPRLALLAAAVLAAGALTAAVSARAAAGRDAVLAVKEDW
jgi:putative ABC transport system permease protein